MIITLEKMLPQFLGKPITLKFAPHACRVPLSPDAEILIDWLLDRDEIMRADGVAFLMEHHIQPYKEIKSEVSWWFPDPMFDYHNSVPGEWKSLCSEDNDSPEESYLRWLDLWVQFEGNKGHFQILTDRKNKGRALQ